MKASSLRHPSAIAALCLTMLSGCSSYTAGMTKEEWQQLNPAYRAKLRAEEAKRAQEILRANPNKDGPVLRDMIADDQLNRDRGPQLLDR